MNSLAKIISEITRQDEHLLYYLPEEVEACLQEKRAVILQEKESLIAFILWDYYGDWIQAHTIYVMPEFRGRGYFRKLVVELKTQFDNPKYKNKKFFLFTRVPAVKHVLGGYGFIPKPYRYLPISVWWKLLRERFQFRKLLSHLKHGFLIFSAMRSGLFVLER